MKKINFNAVCGTLALAAVMLLVGCLNPFEPQLDRGKKAAEGKGYVTVSINKTDARTIVPENTQDSFIQYKLEFYVSGVVNPVKTEFLDPSNIGDEIEMPVGTYDLWVTAYTYFISKEDDSQNTPVAKGNKEVVVENNKPSGASVKLFAIEDGEGTFRWSISYPAGASATITIDPLDDGLTPKKTWTIADTPSADNEKGKADSVELRSGTYRVTFDLMDNEERSLRRSDILHVYMNMESFFGKNGEGDFKEDYFIIKRVNSIALKVATVPTNTPLTLEGDVSPSNATFKDIKWEIIDDPDETGAVIDEDGVFFAKLAKKTGTTKVTLRATIEHGAGYLVDYVQEDKLEVTVTYVEVTGVVVEPTKITLDDGMSTWITAKVTPPEATNKKLKWSPEDTSGIFKIIEDEDNDGIVEVKGLKPGTTRVVVTAVDDTRRFANCEVTVKPVPLTGLTLSAEYVMLPSTGTLEERSTRLRAIFAPPNATYKDLTWKSDVSSVEVEEDGDGTITVVSGNPEVAIITVTNDEGLITATCRVIIDDDAKGVNSVGLHTDVFTDGIKLAVGKTLELKHTITPKGAQTDRIFWASGDFDVVSVVDDGKIRKGHGNPEPGDDEYDDVFEDAKGLPDGTIKALKAGLVEIVVTTAIGGRSAICQVEAYDPDPAQPAIEKIELPPDLHFTRGFPEYIEPIFTPENAGNKKMFWYSSDPSVASIGLTTGLVTAYVPGFTTISVITEDGGLTAECEIEVDYVAIDSVEIITDVLYMVKNQRLILRVSVYPANATYRDVAWSVVTGDEANVYVDSKTGEVTYIGGPSGTGMGSVKVESINQPEKSAECLIRAREGSPLVTGIKLNLHKLRAGTDPETPPMPLVATITPENAEFSKEDDIVWFSTDTYVAEVDQEGQVTGKHAGKAQIIVMAKDGGFTDTCELEIYTGKMTATGIRMNLKDMYSGGDGYLLANIQPFGTTGEIIWDVSYIPETPYGASTYFINIDSSGYITTQLPSTMNFTTTITAYSVEGGFKESCEVIFQRTSGSNRRGIQLITLDSLDLEVGRSTEPLFTRIDPVNNGIWPPTDYKWYSTNPAVAEVDYETGVVTGKTPGETTIIASTYWRGQRTNVDVTVRAKGTDGPAVTGVELNTNAITLAPGQRSGNPLQAFFQPFVDYETTAANTGVYWGSSNPGAASVDPTGVVTANANGTATITATTIDGGYTDTCTVTVGAISGTAPAGLQPMIMKYLTLNLRSNLNVGEYNYGTFKPTFIGNVTPAANQKIDYKIMDPAIVTVDESNGRITAAALGKTLVTATTINGYRQSIEVTVVPAGPGGNGNAAVQSVNRIVMPNTTMRILDAQKIATVEPVNAASKELVFTSSDTAVATVDADGTVHALKIGKTTISATSVDGGKTNSCTVTVKVLDVLISGHSGGNYYMGKYPITQDEYYDLMGSNPSTFKDNPDPGEVQGRRPVETLNQFQAAVFCNMLSIREGLTPVYVEGNNIPVTINSTTQWGARPTSRDANGYRIPDADRWVYAYRAGTPSEFKYYWATNWSNDVWNDAYGWVDTNSNGKTHEVGKKLPNAWGLYDMSGNVKEGTTSETWVNAYAPVDYGSISVGSQRLITYGGSWKAPSSKASSVWDLTVFPNGAYTGGIGLGKDEIGFRVMRLP